MYAVVSGGAGVLRAAGVAGERLRRARVAGVDMVIGTVPRVPRPTAAALTRYDQVVRGLMASHGSLLPARFGTCAASLDELALTVRARRAAIRRSLRLVRQRAQMTIRLFRSSEPARTSFRVGSESVQSRFRVNSEQGESRGRHFLQERAAEMQIPGSQPLRTAVARWVRAERVERHDRGRLAGSLYHLIPRGSAAAYRRAVERAAGGAGLTMVVSGPWPPYAFADLADG